MELSEWTYQANFEKFDPDRMDIGSFKTIQYVLWNMELSCYAVVVVFILVMIQEL